MNDSVRVEPLPEKRAAPNLFKVNLVGLGTIVRKETRRVVRIWLQTIVPPAITMTLYFIIFGSLVGNRIGQMDGVPYTTFIAPGLIMMSVITSNGSSARCSTAASAFAALKAVTASTGSEASPSTNMRHMASSSSTMRTQWGCRGADVGEVADVIELAEE